MMSRASLIKHLSVLCAANIGGAAIATLWGGWDSFMQVLLIFMAVDYIAGILVAARGKSQKSESGRISSNAAVEGLIKKGFALLVVLVAAQLQVVTGGEFVRNTVVLFFIGSEGISIIENAGLLGVPLPKSLVRWFEILRDENEK